MYIVMYILMHCTHVHNMYIHTYYVNSDFDCIRTYLRTCVCTFKNIQFCHLCIPIEGWIHWTGEHGTAYGPEPHKSWSQVDCL